MVTKKRVGIGCMVTGAVCGTYSFINVIRYFIFGEARPFFFQHTQMAFSTSFILTFDNVSLFWIGYSIYYTGNRGGSGRRITFNPSQRIQLILAIISAITLILTAIIGALKEL